MKIDYDPLQVKEANFDEPIDVMMVEITKDSSSKVGEESMMDYDEKIKVLYPKAEEELIYFLNKYMIKG